jgi:hypothetical protein
LTVWRLDAHHPGRVFNASVSAMKTPDDPSDQIIRTALTEFLIHASADDDAFHVAVMDLLRGQTLEEWARDHLREFPPLARLMVFRDPQVPAESLPPPVRRFLLAWSYARQTLAEK